MHCSATSSARDYTPQQLERDHRLRGFNSAGYHFYIRKSGERVPMRPIDEVGAHAKGRNSDSVGICYEGGLDAAGKPADTRTAAQKQELRKLIAELKKRYPSAEVCGHRDLSPDRNGNGTIEAREWIKVCPCFDAKTEYKVL